METRLLVSSGAFRRRGHVFASVRTSEATFRLPLSRGSCWPLHDWHHQADHKLPCLGWSGSAQSQANYRACWIGSSGASSSLRREHLELCFQDEPWRGLGASCINIIDCSLGPIVLVAALASGSHKTPPTPPRECLAGRESRGRPQRRPQVGGVFELGGGSGGPLNSQLASHFHFHYWANFWSPRETQTQTRQDSCCRHSRRMVQLFALPYFASLRFVVPFQRSFLKTRHLALAERACWSLFYPNSGSFLRNCGPGPRPAGPPPLHSIPSHSMWTCLNL